MTLYLPVESWTAQRKTEALHLAADALCRSGSSGKVKFRTPLGFFDATELAAEWGTPGVVMVTDPDSGKLIVQSMPKTPYELDDKAS